MEGETIAGERFDGLKKTAIFPGDLPENPEACSKALNRAIAMSSCLM
jgi:predicted YcjX-like family ATPase